MAPWLSDHASATSLIVTFSTKPTGGNLTAVVLNGSKQYGSAIQVANVKPEITSNTTAVAAVRQR